MELQTLTEGLNPLCDQLILVGDLFDRGFHGNVVYDVIRAFGERCHCLMGNHERKMLKWLKGEKDEVPPHYYWAVRNLYKHGVGKKELVEFLEKLPTMLIFSPEATIGSQVWDPVEEEHRKYLYGSEIVIVHAGVNVHDVMDPDPNYTVYGDSKAKLPWWDRYHGPNLVLYGHLSEKDNKPRMRYMPYETGQEDAVTVSIGLDTGCAHGGALTGYVIETGEFLEVKAEKDWASEMKEECKQEKITGAGLR